MSDIRSQSITTYSVYPGELGNVELIQAKHQAVTQVQLYEEWTRYDMTLPSDQMVPPHIRSSEIDELT